MRVGAPFPAPHAVSVKASDAAISDDVSALLMRGIGAFSHAFQGAYSPYYYLALFNGVF
jgi:hypothetical protein